MLASDPWELPVAVIHPESNHVVGRVYRDGHFIAFERSGVPYYELNDVGTVMHTGHGLHLRLTSDTPILGKEVWGRLLNKAIFDECLFGEHSWSMDEPRFTRMRLPFPNIMEYMSVWPMAEDHAHDGSMTIKAVNIERFTFTLPQISATGCIRFTYDWSSKTFVEQKFTARAELVLEYAAPVPLSVIKEHEERLRSFFDYIWFRGHRSSLLYLDDGERMATLHRRESVSPEVRAAHALNLRGILTHENLADWIERWFSLSGAQCMAIDPVVTIARNSGIITDMKFVMATHAVDALLQDHLTTTAKDSDMSPRFFNNLGTWWQHKDLKGEALKDYIDRVVWTRNEALKAVRHPKATPETLLAPLERARAYFELLLLQRALFLELMDIDQALIARFVEAGFGKLVHQEFRYFRD